MKHIVTIFISLSLVIGKPSSYAQSYTFKVLANKGHNQIKSGSEWLPLKTGVSLDDKNEIKIASPAYIGLVHRGGRTLELKKAGVYSVADLSAKVNSSSNSVAGKYADYVLSKMQAGTKANRLNTTGAVHRGSSDSEIKLMIPRAVEIYNPKVTLNWEKTDLENDVTYEVTLKNMFDDVLKVIDTKDNFLQLDMSQEGMVNENELLVDVKVKGKADLSSEVYAIKKLNSSRSEEIKVNLNELKQAIKEETALNTLILAAFYEENNLMMDALDQYYKAKALAPDVESYEEALAAFIARNGLDN